MEFQHLPKSVVPKLYDLTIDSDLVALEFKGKVEVQCDVIEEVSEVVLNGTDLNVTLAVVCQNDLCAKAEVAYRKEEDRIVLSLKSPLSVGTAKVSIEYTGKILDLLCGYYYSNDTAHPGKYCAISQFEPTDARRAFPCWDEPDIKAEFDVTLVVDKELTALSNMNEVSSEPMPGNDQRKVVKFARTPIMSTYLVAFAVGMFEHIEKVDKNGVLHRVFGDYGTMPLFEKALEISVEALQYLTDFFQIKYPLPKVDHLAVQRYDHGAMENWGLVTYRSVVLSVDPKGVGSQHMQYVHEVVAHELSHQWFGNLVTMKWWTDLWLNEGFASFMQYLVTDFIRPDFEMWSQFVSSALTSALTLDSLRSSHPVEVEVGHPSEVKEIFDIISYQKGCSLNRMAYFFLGKEKFTQGLTNYLNHFAYSNAVTNNLWKFLGDAAGLDLETLMGSWTRQTGFPAVSIDGMTQITPTKCQFKLTQKRHLDDGTEDEANTLWSIPISVIAKSSSTKPLTSFVMKDKTQIVEVEGISEGDWFHFNPDFVGLYVVNYPTANINLLKEAVKQSPTGEILSAESRSSVLFDKFRLAVSGQSTAVELFEFLRCFVDDRHYLIWDTVARIFYSFKAVLYGAGCNMGKLYNFKMEIFGKINTQIGFVPGDNDSHTTDKIRSLVMVQMGAAGHTETVNYCRTVFDDLIKLRKPIPAKIRSSVLRVVAYNITSTEELEQFITLYKESKNIEEKQGLLVAMGCVQTEELALKTVEFAMSSDVPTGDQIYPFRSFSNTMKLGDFLLKYCEDNFAKLRDACGGLNATTLSDVLKSCSKPFFRVESLEVAERILREHKVDMFTRGLAQNKETVEIRAKAIEREGASLKSFFDKI